MTLVEWPRRVAALGQFHSEDLAGATLAKDAEHHLRKVLRAKEGEEVVLSDGRGSWALAAVTTSGLERSSDVLVDPPLPETVLYLSPLKGDRDEWAIAKATEIGVSRVVPLLAERTVVKFTGEARAKVLARWRRIALESAGQCRRTYDLVIDEPVNVAHVPRHVAVADLDGPGDWRGVRAVAVGPEGGWGNEGVGQ